MTISRNFSLIVIFFLLGYFLVNQSLRMMPENIKYVRIAGENIKVDLALTQEIQEKGLSGRTGLEHNTGMLFVFDHPGDYHFWMKDMDFPIDIIWLGKDLKVVYIKEDARPELFPETYGPTSLNQDGVNKDAQYVLEIASGFSEKNNLQIGDRVEFIR